MNTEFWAIGLTLSAALIGSFGALFFKFAADEFSFNLIRIIKNKYLYFAIFYYVLATVLFIPALKGGELSFLYPLSATSYILISLLSTIFLKEKINFWRWLGIFTIIFGIFLMGLGS